ncbi:MAG: AI-2E family transporter [bacterium]
MEKEHSLTITTGSWVRGALVLAAAYALYQVHGFLLVIIASVIIASAVEPAAVWAKRKHVSRLLIILTVYVSVAIILAGLFYFLFLPLLGETTDFVRSLPSYTQSNSTEILTASLVPDGLLNKTSTSLFSINEFTSHINSFVNSFSQGVFSSVSLVFGGALSFILIIVLSFYLAVQEAGIAKFLAVIVPFKHEKYAIDLWKRSQRKIGLWMQGQLLLAVIVMVLVYLGLLLIGLPHALLLSVLAGVFELIPLFGPILSAIPAIFVAFAFGGTSMALIVAGLFLIIQQFENHLIYPLVVKKVVGVPPMVSILALVVGGQLAGFLGILISVPLAAVLMEFFSDLEKDKLARSAEKEAS